MQTRICAICGKQFETNSSRRKICYDDHFHACPVCCNPFLTRDLQHLDECCCKEHSRQKAASAIHDRFDVWPASSEEAKIKREATCLQRYGVKNAGSASKDVISSYTPQPKMLYKKICSLCGEEFETADNRINHCNKVHIKTCLKCGKQFEYFTPNGSDYCSPACAQADSGNQSRKKTCLERYGVDNANKIEGSQDKSKETCLKKYGVEYYSMTQERNDRVRSTLQTKYGVDNPMQSLDIVENYKQSMIEKYGHPYPMQVPEIFDKTRRTCLERYGSECVLASESIKNKWLSEYQKKTGYAYPVSDPEVKARTSQTVMDRYGVPWACMRDEARQYRTISNINKAFADLLHQKGIEYSFEFRIENRSYDIKVENNLIELDPTATHNTAVPFIPGSALISKDYHMLKSKLAKDNSYHCIHIFDWDNWEDIIDSMIQPTIKVYARNCDLKEIDKSTAEQFMNENHIQHSCRGQICNYGLYHENILIEIMTFGQPRYNRKYKWELLRLATLRGYNIVGGASKLFKKFTTDHLNESIISYCDLAKFSGEVYEKIGMKLDHISDPAKIWSRKNERITDNLLRQRGYDQLFKTDFGKGTSNEQLMLDNGWLPVYDCGQAVYILN